MAAPPPSRLDSRQVLQGAFDEDTGRLRTTADATIVNADIDVALDSAEDSVEIANAAGVPLTINVDGSVNITDNGGSITVDALSLPLPTGAATSALQTTGNASLSSIDGKTPALIAGRVPVASEQSGTWTVNTEEIHPDTTAITSLPAAITNQTALVANPNRKGVIIYRAGTGICYVKLGTTATITDYTIQMTNNTIYELPFPCYTGRIDVIFSSINGTIKITEII